MQMTTIGLFHTVSHTLSGYASEADYNAGTDPFGVASNIAIPMLAINALDDPVCVEGNIEYKFFTEQSDCSILASRHAHS